MWNQNHVYMTRLPRARMTEIKLVMPSPAGIQTRIPAAKTQNRHSGHRNDGSHHLKLSRTKRLALPFLLVFGLTLARAEFGTAQTLEKVRIGMPSLSLSFIAPQLAYAREGSFARKGSMPRLSVSPPMLGSSP